MTEITRQNFTDAVTAAVDERGANWTYPEYSPENVAAGWYDDLGASCQYALRDGTPACLVGLALFKIDPELVPAHGWVIGSDGSVGTLFKQLGVTDDELMNAAETLQSRQDRGLTLGYALTGYLDDLGL
jgi:hypothetical protein